MRSGDRVSIKACLLALALTAGSPVRADEAPTTTRYDWSGFYVGAHLGGARGRAHLGAPLGRALIGLEADVSWADLYGTNTCFAFSGFYVSANCGVDIDAAGTLAGRFGWLLGADDGTLVYAKAGGAWQHTSTAATTGGGAGLPPTSADGFRWGWMLGAGAERAISERWSVKAEYEYLAFGSDGVSTPPGLFQPVPSADPNALTTVASIATDLSQDAHLLKLGINYRLGETRPLDAPATSAPPVQPIAGTTLEIGARYVYGWGRFQKDLGIPGLGLASPASRLTYGGNATNGGELFARIDTASGLMAKGFVGKGEGDGQLNDEDWGLQFALFVPYSNTISRTDDHIRYGVIDVGYDVWRDQRFRMAGFIGYSIMHQYLQGFGCAQIANPNSDCATPVPTSVYAISEDDVWRGIRLGIAADMQIVPRLTLSADAAYLPYVRFEGVDDHVLRTILSPEWANGTGAQLELILSYAVTDQFRVGVGGRYWSMWTKDGWVNFGGQVLVPMRYSVEQAALLVQGSYTFSDAAE